MYKLCFIGRNFHRIENGSNGIGVKIFARLPQFLSKECECEIGHAGDTIFNSICSDIEIHKPGYAEYIQSHVQSLVDLFGDEKIYAEEIPNEYWSEKSAAPWLAVPWLVVTTRIGHFKIGWRKLVICIDWEKTRAKNTASELFPEEDVTKDGKMIHAWGEEKAREYIRKVIAKTDENVAAEAKAVEIMYALAAIIA